MNKLYRSGPHATASICSLERITINKKVNIRPIWHTSGRPSKLSERLLMKLAGFGKTNPMRVSMPRHGCLAEIAAPLHKDQKPD